MPVTCALKDETYAKVKQLANNAGAPVSQIMDLFINFALEHAIVKHETKIQFSDMRMSTSAEDRTHYVTPVEQEEQPPEEQQPPKKIGEMVFQIVSQADRPLTAREIRQALRDNFGADTQNVNGVADANKNLVRHKTVPYSWGLNKHFSDMRK